MKEGGGISKGGDMSFRTKRVRVIEEEPGEVQRERERETEGKKKGGGGGGNRRTNT